jgi:hypothetical protein
MAGEMKDPKTMRRETVEAISNIKDIFAAQGMMMVNLMGWNLPPGCTDKDIDDAANGPGDTYQCDCCGKMWPADEMVMVRAGALGNSAGCDTVICPECRGEDEEE